MNSGSVRFGVISDWHLGLNDEGPAIPGDVFDGAKSSQIDTFLAHTKQVQVFLVLGSHDLYKSRRDKGLRVLRDAFRGTQVSKETDRTVLFSNPYGYAYRQEPTEFDPGARLVVDRRGNVEVFHS